MNLVLASKKDDLKLINSAKHYLVLKRIHEILPEKHCRQEYNTKVWSDVFQKYYNWKKSQVKKGFKTLQILPKAAAHPTKYGKANSKKS